MRQSSVVSNNGEILIHNTDLQLSLSGTEDFCSLTKEVNHFNQKRYKLSDAEAWRRSLKQGHRLASKENKKENKCCNAKWKTRNEKENSEEEKTITRKKERKMIQNQKEEEKLSGFWE